MIVADPIRLLLSLAVEKEPGRFNGACAQQDLPCVHLAPPNCSVLIGHERHADYGSLRVNEDTLHLYVGEHIAAPGGNGSRDNSVARVVFELPGAAESHASTAVDARTPTIVGHRVDQQRNPGCLYSKSLSATT